MDEGNKSCQVIFIRHGERADMAPEKNVQYDVKCDAPLTPLGVTQVEETGLYLKKYIEDNKFEEVVIEASPFIRTIQSAILIA
jgi:broad specificity phosphatase PhoE